MLIKWHDDQRIADGEPHQRPEPDLDLRPLSRRTFDELDMCCRLGTSQKEIGLIDAVSHHPCNHPKLASEVRWLPAHLLKDGARDSEIPLRTGCDAAALSKFTQMAGRGQDGSLRPGFAF